MLAVLNFAPETRTIAPVLPEALQKAPSIVDAMSGRAIARRGIFGSDEVNGQAGGGYVGQLPGGEAEVFHAGTKRLPDGSLVTNGGRVLGVTALAESLPEAIERAYAAAGGIRFEKLHMRRDIGARALAALGERR